MNDSNFEYPRVTTPGNISLPTSTLGKEERIVEQLHKNILLLNTIGRCPQCLENFKVSIKENEMSDANQTEAIEAKSNVYKQQSPI